ncbi:MAG: phosphomannomutase/phosphoglucomutase [Syntrophorhabdus sp.]
MNNQIFREYDIRGDVERDLTDDVVRNIGSAFGTYMKRLGKSNVSVCRDCRLSSGHYRDLLIESMTASGLHVTDIGLAPTPLFYYSLFTLDVEGGIMITGSHNPPTMNGFKIAVDKSTLYGEQIQAIRSIIESGDFTAGQGKADEYRNIIQDYHGYLRSNIHLKKKFKVVIDAGNGTGGIVAAPIMREFGQDITELYCEMDGHFPNHFPDPTVEKNLVALRETILTEKADVGIGYDGDADRIGVVDEKGGIIWGDYLMLIFARQILKEHGKGIFISEVKCSRNLFEDIRAKGGDAIMWKAGHSLIKQKMKETHALMGGEMSGHIFFADRFFGFDDAIYASLRFLEIMEQDGRPVSDFLADVPKSYFTPELRIDCPDDVKMKVVEELTELYRAQYPIIDIDGVRATIDGGWGLVRSSNTQPILVLRFEADTQQNLDRIQARVMEDLENIMKKY